VISDGTAAVDVSANNDDTFRTILNLRQGVRRRIFDPLANKCCGSGSVNYHSSSKSRACLW
jgi:hypothetical protein